MTKKMKGGQNMQIENSKPLTIENSPNNNSSNNDKFTPVKRLPYDIKIFSFLCVMGLLVRVIFAQTEKDYATATVYGYGFSILAVFGLMITTFAVSYRNQFSQGIFGFIKIVLANAVPAIFLLIILGLLLYQSIAFYDQINKGEVSEEFYQVSGVSSVLLIFQAMLVINYTIEIYKGNQADDATKKSLMGAFSSQLSSILLILSFVNLIFIGFIQIILKYFSTDG